jgi:hypothetical protein
MKSPLLTLALAVSAFAQTSKPTLYTYYADAAGKWIWKPLIIEGATLDLSGATAVLRIQSASQPQIDWTKVTLPYSQITGAPTFRFNGPWLRATVAGTETTVGLMPGRTVVDRTVVAAAPSPSYRAAFLPAEGSMLVHVNGVMQEAGADYTVSADRRVVTFAPASVPAPTATVTLTYRTHE